MTVPLAQGYHGKECARMHGCVWQVGKEFSPLTSLPGRHPPRSSVPSSRCIHLGKAQGSIANAIFYHWIIASQGVGAFRERCPSNLGERQGWALTLPPPPPPLTSDSPDLPRGLFITLLHLDPQGLPCISTFLFCTKKL